MFNDTSSAAALLASRRSGKPRDMVAPGPSPDELREMLMAAVRVPDHGKLAPWRFVIVRDDQREALATLLAEAARAEKPDAAAAELAAAAAFAHQAPALVVALSAPVASSPIPVWEQELSTGAACMNLLVAAHARGFVGGWLTGWAAYSPGVRAAFAAPHERIAGFMFLGSPGRALEERPRPRFDEVVSEWQPPVVS